MAMAAMDGDHDADEYPRFPFALLLHPSRDNPGRSQKAGENLQSTSSLYTVIIPAVASGAGTPNLLQKKGFCKRGNGCTDQARPIRPFDGFRRERKVGLLEQPPLGTRV